VTGVQTCALPIYNTNHYHENNVDNQIHNLQANLQDATSQLSQTTLRSIVGQIELDELLAERDKINHELQKIIDKQSDPWGIKVSLVEVKHIDLPIEMKRAMAKQAERSLVNWLPNSSRKL
jgi:regulator of protease activity HflC (stomatin/prohibitin superfamily)